MAGPLRSTRGIMHAQPARTHRIGVGATLLLVSIGLWAFTFAWMRVPYYLFHAEGQLYALSPIAFLTEAVVIVLVIIAAVFAIVDVVRRHIRILNAVLVLVGSALMLTLGPILILFGTIPIGANLLP